jgi:alanyl-tRNA synthetase
VTGAAAEELVERRLAALHDAAQLLGDREEHVAARVQALLDRVHDAEKAAREPRARQASRLDASAALAGATQAGDARVVVESFPEADANALRGLADDLRAATGRFVAVAAGSANGPALMVAASRDLVAEGFDAVPIVRSVAPMIGGGGGGRADLAQAGGKEAARLDEALREAARLALEALRKFETG